MPMDAKSVPIDAFPKVSGAPFRVRVTHAARPVLARCYPEPKAGERVLLMLLSHDLLSLFVAIVEPRPGTSTAPAAPGDPHHKIGEG